VDLLTQAGIGAAALAAIITTSVMIGKGLRRMWHLMQKLDRAAEDILGAPNQPSLRERLDELAREHDEHLAWHSGRSRARANGGRP